jgi:hypothetical protein
MSTFATPHSLASSSPERGNTGLSPLPLSRSMSPLELPIPMLTRENTMWGEDSNTKGAPRNVEVKCRMCSSVYSRPEHDTWNVMCRDCFVVNVRKCETCKTQNLRIDAPAWKKTCTSCWMKERKQTHAICPTCPEKYKDRLRRPIGRPSCVECYRKRKQHS